MVVVHGGRLRVAGAILRPIETVMSCWRSRLGRPDPRELATATVSTLVANEP